MGDVMISLENIIEASKRISPYIYRTPLLRMAQLDELMGCQVYLKPENLQVTGSFKLRGAMNCLLQLNQEKESKGIVCASSGNHAKAVAHASRELKINGIFVMPTNYNPQKFAGVKALGGEIILEGRLSSERMAKAKEFESQGYELIHSHADSRVIAGQGTIGLEIIEQMPDMDTIVVPIGGGGLISGIATAVKSINSNIRIVGAEPSGAARYAKSREKARPMELAYVNTIADGTRCNHANADNFAIIEALVDDLISAKDETIKKAMRLLVERGKVVAEPSSSLGLAAALEGNLPVSKQEKLCFVITGGNNDLELLSSIISD